MIVSLEEAKKHLRVTGCEADDDIEIINVIEDVEVHIANRLKCDSLEEAFPDDSIPRAVRRAALLLIAHYYENRSAVSNANLKNIEEGVDSLLDCYVKYHTHKA